MQIPVPVATVGLLVLSNVFMTFAWYGHLKHKSMALPMVIFISWCIAFFEYVLQVPANRIGYGYFNAAELKTIQEVISLTVFTVIVTVMFKGQALQWNHFAAFLCLVAAVFFVFLK